MPNNVPTRTCVMCGHAVAPHVTEAANTEGQVYVMAMDEWCTYYWDTLGHRDEFCSPQCVHVWLTNKSITP